MAYVFFDKIYKKKNFFLKILNCLYLSFKKINQIIKCVVLWIYFFHSLIRCNKKYLLLHSISLHHLNRFSYKKKDFVKKGEKTTEILFNNYSIITVNFDSNLMLKFLILFLKIFYNEKKYVSISSYSIQSKINKYRNLIIKNNFDLFNRNLFLKSNFLLPNTFKSYKSHFTNYSRRFHISKRIINSLLNILNLKSVKGVLLHENGYRDALIYELFCEYNKEIVFSNSPINFVLFKKSLNKNKKNFHRLFSAVVKKEINNISNNEYNLSKKFLNLRTARIYKSISMSYMITPSKLERNRYYLKFLKPNCDKHSIVFFMNCLTDAPNSGGFDDTNYYVNYYHFLLKLIDHSAKKNIDLYIKPHPQFYQYPSESIFMEKITEVVKNYKKKYFINIEILNPSTSLNEIKKKFNNSIFFLIRGSVMSELLYLNMPTIYFADCLYSEFLSKLKLTNLKKLDSKFINAYIKNFKDNSHNYSNLAIKLEAVLEKFKVNSIDKKIKITSSMDNKKINNLFSKLNVINY